VSEPLSPSEEALVTLSAAMGARCPDAVDAALRRAAAAAGAAEVEEALLQSYLFLGYPAALNAFAAWRDISGAAPPEPSADAASWEERGVAVCRRVYGGQYEALRAHVGRLHPDMERWMVHEGYGKVLGRPGLDVRVRELCIAALLASLDAQKQLYSHLRGALNAGASPAQVHRALELAATVSGPGLGERAAKTWKSVLTRSARDV